MKLEPYQTAPLAEVNCANVLQSRDIGTRMYNVVGMLPERHKLAGLFKSYVHIAH